MMRIDNNTIIEKAREIVGRHGTKGLSVVRLARELDVGENDLLPFITKDDDVFLLLLLDLEANFIKLTRELSHENQSPDIELQLFFRRLYFIFEKNPHYRSIIFDDSLYRKNKNIAKTFMRIRDSVEYYLSKIIDEGKREKRFKTKQSTQLLVNSIILSFRSFVEDEHLINEMIRELQTLRVL
ncbi:hypothetical protein [Saccharicrinis carchari]|nr:hypothetical protein [Saccharicrinis carchari]